MVFHNHDLRFGEAGAHFDLRITLRPMRKGTGERDAGYRRWPNLADFERNGERFIRKGSGTGLARHFGLFHGGNERAILDYATGRITEQTAQTHNNLRHVLNLRQTCNDTLAANAAKHCENARAYRLTGKRGAAGID